MLVTTHEKLYRRFVDLMHSDELFTIKDMAERIGVTRITIYNYIKRYNEEAAADAEV